MDIATLAQNILLGLTLAAPIGPVNVEIIRRGLRSGFRQALATGAGAMTADAVYLTLIFFGLAALLTSAILQIALGLGGSLILIYLGAAGMREYFKKNDTDGKPSSRRLSNPFAAGFVLAISSPMTIVWWSGVFGAFLGSQATPLTGFLAYVSCLTILLGCFLWVLFLAAALHWGKKIVNDRMTRLISLVAGLFLVGFGVYFLWRTLLLMLAAS